MKYEFCDQCYFNGVEPAMCDECEDGDQFEPAEADDDAFDRLMKLSGQQLRAKVIPIRALKIARPVIIDESEPELCYA